MAKIIDKPHRILGIFTLAMINVAAICSIRNLPVMAEYGLSSLFLVVLAAIIFFIPSAMTSAELASGWPKAGGIFAWVKEAFGHRTGFLAIWLLWIENVIWYPTALSFIAATIAYIYDPTLSNNTLFNIGIILVVFWAVTLANLGGMRTSGWISTLGVIAGTLLPGLIIILLGLNWYASDQPLQITFDLKSIVPDFTSINQLVFFTGIILALVGMEMSAVHVRDVQNPQRDYPRAVFLSGLIIIAFYIFGALAIAMVVPQKQISLTAGSLQAFSTIVERYGLKWLTPYMAGLILIGAVGALSTWTVGPSRGLLAAAQQGDLPPFFRRVNRHGMPVALLITQASIVSVLSLLFIFMPSVSSAYWILSVLITQLYLVMYLLLFAAVIKLRYKRPKTFRPYKIPGGKVGLWIVAGLGIISSIFTFVMSFFPPSQITTGGEGFYVGFLTVGIIVFTTAPFIILLFQRPNWKQRLSHETTD